ncbi:PHD finger protein 21B [Frankliniella fusca]|uniref:PHD finger protein 21B n=1 Tax=Frankliniella fusca TaxID=407009 RepID=A0AAE1HEK7_9NEOP|nr:PHD finger protein 21B [Frankliniella fusca]
MKLATANTQLLADIRSVQSQLKSAIQNHQMIVFKLKDRPVSIKLRVQMCNVQRHIVSLGEKQKKLLAQLRKELETTGGIMKTEQKPSVEQLTNFKPNPLNPLLSSKPISIKKEIDVKSECSDGSDSPVVPVKSEVPQHTSRRKSKLVATPDLPILNGHSVTPSTSPSHKENTPSSTPSSSPTHSLNINKPQRQSSSKTPKRESTQLSTTSDDSQDTYINLPVDPEQRKKLQFMTALSLVTREVLTELQNRRTERKRRSTANPQFYYGSAPDLKRKRTLYLANTAVGIEPMTDFTKSKDQGKPQSCYACSGSTGVICQCSLCPKAFHWHCVFDTTVPIPSGEAVRCRTCLSTSQTNGLT